MGKPKVPLVNVPSDDCVVYLGRKIEGNVVADPGKPINPHMGESVQMLQIQGLGELLALGRFAAIAEGTKDAESMLQMDVTMDRLCEGIAGRVIAWDWTDMMGDPLPQPYKRPDIIKALTAEEIMWLRGAVEGETPAARKNASGPLPSISSAGARKRPR